MKRNYRARPVGWKGESHRHYLAAKGIKTKRYYAYVPTYAVGDMSLIAADGVGTAGAAVIPWIPVAVPLLIAYGGVKYAKNRKKKTGSYFMNKSDLLSESIDRLEESEYFDADRAAMERARLARMAPDKRARAEGDLRKLVEYAQETQESKEDLRLQEDYEEDVEKDRVVW